MGFQSKPKNIFGIHHKHGLEDRFTESLGYILLKYPDLAQRFLDRISENCSLDLGAFEDLQCHPLTSGAERPDFVLVGKNGAIYCEHKVGSGLGTQQLQRYLTLVKSKKSFLTLIANEPVFIDEKVVQDDSYLRAKQLSRSHFLWSDFYRIFETDKREVVQEFAQWMADLGMSPYIWPGEGDPFSNSKAFETLREVLYSATKSTFEKFARVKGRRVQLSKASLFLQIQKPIEGIHLITLHATKATEFENSTLPQLQAKIWIKNEDRILPTQNLPINSVLGEILFSFHEDVYSSWDPEVYLEGEFNITLANVLGKNRVDAEKNIEGVLAQILQQLEIWIS